MRVWHFAGPAKLGYKPWVYPHTAAESYDRYVAPLTPNKGKIWLTPSFIYDERPINVFSDVIALWWHFLYGAVRSYGLEHTAWWQKEHELLMSAPSPREVQRRNKKVYAFLLRHKNGNF